MIPLGFNRVVTKMRGRVTGVGPLIFAAPEGEKISRDDDVQDHSEDGCRCDHWAHYRPQRDDGRQIAQEFGREQVQASAHADGGA